MKTYKVGDTIKFRIRTDGDPATDNPTATVHDETDTPLSPDLTIGAGLTQVGSTRIVVGTFTPDADGEWSVHMVDDTGMDLVKQFFVGDFSIESIGANVASVEAKVDAQDTVLASILAKVNNIGGGGHFG